MNYIIFSKTCLYDSEQTIIFIQSKTIITDINITSSNSNKKYNTSQFKCDVSTLPAHDYGIIVHYKEKLDNINIIINNSTFQNIKIYYPFEKILKNISNDMNVISTLVKNYNHRLEEWIIYNINLGFDKIIIFNNELSTSHELNEGNDYIEPINIVTDKYKDNVYTIDFPYSAFEGLFWNNIQRMSLHISLTGLNNKCNYCSYIDADEFIYMNNNNNNIKEFLKKFDKTLKMESNILTNKNNNDIISNNILSICNYIGQNMYTKLFVYMKNIPNLQGSNNIIKFLPSPHNTPYSLPVSKDIIMHFHCWVNERYNYNKSQKYISLLD